MSFQTALSGLNAASTHLDVTAHNIANVQTSGFKESRAEFADVYATSSGDVSATATGSGVRISAVKQQFSQGTIDFTDSSLDLAISGEGFFVLEDSEGIVYTRSGAFSVDNEGYVVNYALQRLQVYPTSAGDSFSTGSLEDLQLVTSENPPQETSVAEIGVNLPVNESTPAVTTFDPLVADSFNNSSSLTIYDSLGATHSATTYYVKSSVSNAWDTYLYIDGNAVGGANTLTFDSSGNLIAPASGQITYPSYDAGNGSSPIVLTQDFIDTTQYGGEFGVNQLTQDGYPTGRLTGIEIDQNGVVSARFTNGQADRLGKVALAIFTNPNGLQQTGDTTWGETFASGQPRRGEAGTSDFGLIQSGALENSNVNLTDQLVEMITAQRNFEANSQMIQTADAVTQTILNIR